MRRLLLAGLLAIVPAVPASAGPATCVVGNGFPVCAGTCQSGDTITIRVVGVGFGSASCGGGTAACSSFRATCEDTAQATSSGSLSCSASGTTVVFCTVSIAAT